MSSHTRLVRRGSVYYFRCKVPVDLQEHYGKKEICRSLLTKDHREALQKVRLESLKQDQEFAEARRKLSPETLDSLSQTELDRLAAIKLHQILKDDEQERMRGLTEADLEMREHGLDEIESQTRDALATGYLGGMTQDVALLLEEQGIKLHKDSEAYRKLSYALLKSWGRAIDLIKLRDRGETVDTPPAPAPFKGLSLDGEALSLSQVFEKWKEEKRTAGTPEKTLDDFWTHTRRFIELHGDLPIKTITKAHVRDYKDAMLRLPSRLTKGLKGKTVPQLLEFTAKNPDSPCLSPKTVNDKSLGAVSALLQWAMVNGYIENNPAAGIKVATRKRALEKRLPYSTDDLNLIFHLPIYTQGERPRAGRGEAAKWLPLLALFTGARLEELGQLRVHDVKEEEGIPYLDINDTEDGKHLKTSASRRRVPVHPELIKLGFLEYVQERRKAGDEQIFPLLRSEDDKLTAAWSKWWGRYPRAHGLPDKRKVFHSFRHTAKDGFRDSGVPEPVFDAIQGHTSGTVSRSYGQGYSIQFLADEMKKLRYPGLDLSHLKMKG